MRTIVFSDIESSTDHIERLGDTTWVRLLREHNEIVRRHVREFGGEEVKFQGDGFMLSFEDACAATRCAVAIQHAFASLTPDTLLSAIRVRLGVHAGDVTAVDGDLVGRTVCLASRITAAAQGGEVLISDTVRGLLSEMSPPCEAGRELELKGLSGLHRVFRVAWESALAAAA
jgi:class 3 adenylate cyclase